MTLISADDRIAVFGGRGMAGSAACRALQRHGYSQLLLPSRVELDCLNQDAVERWMEHYKPDVVVLAAARVGGILANNQQPADFLLDNIKIQIHVIESAWRAGVRRLLFLGSSCIYPKFAKQPIREEALLTGSLEPTNEWYAIAKISGIKMCEALRRQHGFDAISLMPTNLYGTGDNYNPNTSHVLPALLRRFHEAKQRGDQTVTCWGTGSPLREFLHADDLGEACVFVLENWSALAESAPRDDAGQPLAFMNVGTGIDLSIYELATRIAATVGFNGTVEWDTTKPDGTPKKQLEVSRLRAMGWTAAISLPDGLARAYADFKQALSEKRLRG